MIGLAKRLEEIFCPGDPLPLYLDRRSITLRIIQQLRDEAHRFGITHHRLRRSKSALVSSLDAIKGIGTKSREVLLSHFGSVEKIRRATPEDLAAVIGAARARLVAEYFSQKDKAQDSPASPSK